MPDALRHLGAVLTERSTIFSVFLVDLLQLICVKSSWQISAMHAEEELSMQETKRMADEAKRMGQEAQEHAKKVGEQSQETLQTGFEAASQSLGEINKGFQAIAAEMTEYSKKTLEDVFHAWEQLLLARSLGEIVDIQTRYAKKAYDTHIAEMSKLTEIYRDLTRKAATSAEHTAKKFT